MDHFFQILSREPRAQKAMLSLFSGAGGDTCGFEQAGWKVTHFSEFNDAAIETHQAAFPDSKLLIGTNGSKSIKDIPDATFQALAGRIDLIFAGFPCFVAGTHVLTEDGYKPIEDVTLSDKLLTHTGAFQPIVNLQRKIYDRHLYDLRLKYHPALISATEEHPFYVRTRIRTWDNTRRKYTFHFEEPTWKPLKELTVNDFCGMPINTESIIPTHDVLIQVNKHVIRETRLALDNKDMWFMMGYFVGDGWIQDSKKTDGSLQHIIRFVINDKDQEEVLPRIQAVIPITDKKARSGLCSRYGCADITWYSILKQFGKYAHGKKIPEWVQSAPRELLEEFVRGYTKADGCHRKDGSIRIVTVSYDLAMGLQRIYLKLGSIATVHKTIRPKKYVIQGRTVNQRDTYEITHVPIKQKCHSGFIERNYAWMAPMKITQRMTSEPCEVYNFEVATDNSYIVENTIVHNCQGFSHAGKKNSSDPRNELVHEFVRATKLIQPTWIIGENVKGLLARKGVYPANTSPRPVIDIIKELFEKIGYKISYRVIDAVEVGVPQKRKRLIIVGHKGDQYPIVPWDPLPPLPEHPTIRALLTSTLEGAMELPALYKPQEQSTRYWIPTQETQPTGQPHPNLVRLVNGIRNLSSQEKKDQNLDPKVAVPFKEPNGLISFGVRKGGYHGEILYPDAPSKTIICTYNLCPRLFVGLHNPTTNTYWIRCLTPVECGRIQGFPADYPWQGTDKQKIIQIGNAVPPPLATTIANLLEKITFSNTPQQVEATNDNEPDEEDEEA